MFYTAEFMYYPLVTRALVPGVPFLAQVHSEVIQVNCASRRRAFVLSTGHSLTGCLPQLTELNNLQKCVEPRQNIYLPRKVNVLYRTVLKLCLGEIGCFFWCGENDYVVEQRHT